MDHIVCYLLLIKFISVIILQEFEKDLIAILLVVESVHDKNKLLYKFEKVNVNKRERMQF